MRVLKIVGDSLIVSLDWEMYAGGLTALYDFLDGLIVWRNLNHFEDSLDV